jgi:predicted GIY-YIG superfamily endonuclease
MAQQILGAEFLSGIYQIKNLLNNKIYIGSTVDFKTRWYSHKRKA